MVDTLGFISIHRHISSQVCDYCVQEFSLFIMVRLALLNLPHPIKSWPFVFVHD